MAALVEAAAQAAEFGYADTVAAMRGTKPYGRSTLQTYACNGTHVLYGLYDALRHGYEGKQPPRARARPHQGVVLPPRRRGRADRPGARRCRAAAQCRRRQAAVPRPLDRESALRRAPRIYVPTAAERQQLATAERQLAEVVQRITTVHNLDALASAVPRAYRIVLRGRVPCAARPHERVGVSVTSRRDARATMSATLADLSDRGRDVAERRRPAGRSLASLAAARAAGAELIVVDNASSDDTVAVVRRLAPDAAADRQPRQSRLRGRRQPGPGGEPPALRACS